MHVRKDTVKNVYGLNILVNAIKQWTNLLMWDCYLQHALDAIGKYKEIKDAII